MATQKAGPAKVLRTCPRAASDLREPNPGSKRNRWLGAIDLLSISWRDSAALFLASDDYRCFVKAKEIEIGEHGRDVFLFHGRAAGAARIFAMYDFTGFDQHLASASGIGAMPTIFCFHLHERSLARQVFSASHRSA
jgi:hypothetical protein